eukprot:PhM_4_TR2359/c0_g1_i1/m.54318
MGCASSVSCVKANVSAAGGRGVSHLHNGKKDPPPPELVDPATSWVPVVQQQRARPKGVDAPASSSMPHVHAYYRHHFLRTFDQMFFRSSDMSVHGSGSPLMRKGSERKPDGE